MGEKKEEVSKDIKRVLFSMDKTERALHKKGNWATVSIHGNCATKTMPIHIFVEGLYEHFSKQKIGPEWKSTDVGVNTVTIVTEALHPIDADVANHPEQFLKAFAKLLREVHGGGILHFDLKLDNVMKTKDGDLRLIDFDRVGCAHLYMPGPTTSIPPQEIEIRYDKLEKVTCDCEMYAQVGMLIFLARYVLDGNFFPPQVMESINFKSADDIMKINAETNILQNYVDDIVSHAQCALEEGEEEPFYSVLFKLLFIQQEAKRVKAERLRTLSRDFLSRGEQRKLSFPSTFR